MNIEIKLISKDIVSGLAGHSYFLDSLQKL